MDDKIQSNREEIIEIHGELKLINNEIKNIKQHYKNIPLHFTFPCEGLRMVF